MTEHALQPAEPGRAYDTDVVIIGAGPVGLFTVFELGLLDIRAQLVDILSVPGGQCAELYPEKPIYDIPALPVVTGQELTHRLLEQIKPFAPAFHAGQLAAALHKEQDEDGRDIWKLETDLGTSIRARAVIIAAGGGSFVPKKPAIPKIEEYEGISVFYAVRQMERFRDQRLVIAGGGDSALDWALNLQPLAERVTLVHRRDHFRAAPDSVNKMRALVDAGKMDLKIAQIKGLQGEDGKLGAVEFETADGDIYSHESDSLLAFYGLTMKLGPIAEFGLNMHENLIPVDTKEFQTSAPGIFAVGDINHYPGKLKLILSGFHEAALAAQAIFPLVHPDRKWRFQYTTASSDIHKKLGVA